jgi:WD40 repeat protein/serine/threonine protein kinase
MELRPRLAVRANRDDENRLKDFWRDWPREIVAPSERMKVSSATPPDPLDPVEEAVFNAASALADPPTRAAFLNRACGNDTALRARMEVLLQAHDRANQFFGDDPLDLFKRVEPRPDLAGKAPDERPGAMIGRYKLLEKIGEGGCGVVYMAEQDEPIRRRVALKIIKPGMDSRQVIARFEAERQALAMMDHPNIAKVFDGGVTGDDNQSGRAAVPCRPDLSGALAGEVDGAAAPPYHTPARPYFVMELVRGIRITDYCAQHNLSTRQRLDLFIAVCHAVQHAHQKGIIHRDLKPSNILVTENDGQPVPKVIDFGIAKATEQKLTDKTLFTQFAAFLGTPAYMSPEQAAMTSLDIDTRSDIYSLGVLLYELLTGTTPFDAQELLKSGFDEMRRIIRETEPERPSTRLSTRWHGSRGEKEKRSGVLPVGRDSVEPKNPLGADDGQPGHGGRALGPETSLAPLSSVAEGTDDSKVDQGSTESRPTGRGRAVVSNPQSALRNPHSAIDPDLDWIVMKCLEKDRTCRYETANGLAADLQRHLNNEPVAARPPSAAYRFGKLVRRNKGAFAAAATLLFVAALGFIGVLTQWRRAEQQRSRAELQSHRAEANAANERRERYYASIAAADSHIRNGDIDVALSVLTNCPPELRHWEWGRLLYLCHQSIATTRLPTNNLEALIVNAAGTRAVAAPLVFRSAGRTVCWDVPTGREVFEVASETNSVVAMTFSPDGERLAAALLNGAIKVWHADSGREQLQLTTSNEVHALQFNEAGTRLAVSLFGGRGLLLDAATGQALLTTPDPARRLRTGALDPTGRYWVTMDDDALVTVRDARTGEARFSFQGHETLNPTSYRKAPMLAFSPDGRRLLVHASAESAKVWNLETGRELLFIPSKVFSVAFDPGGNRVAVSAGGKTAAVWDLTTGGKTQATYSHQQRLNFVGFDRAGRRLRTGSTDGILKTWSAQPGREWLPHPFHVDFVAFRPNGERFITTQFDGVARIWETASGRELLNFRGNWCWLRTASFSPDGKRIVTGGADRRVRIFDAETGRELLVMIGHTSGVRTAVFSPDGQKVATGSFDKTVKLWDALTGQELFTLRGHTEAVKQVVFSRDGTRLYSAAHDSAVRVWDPATGQQSLAIGVSNTAMAAVALSPDGRRLITGSVSGSLRLWDTGSGELLTRWATRAGVMSLDFSPDGKRLLVVASDRTGVFIQPSMEIWDVETGRQILILSGHPSMIVAARFSPDGQRILNGSVAASGMAGGAARLWEAFPWVENAYPNHQATPGTRSSRREEAQTSISHLSTLHSQPPSQSLVTSAATIQDYATEYWRARLAAEDQAFVLGPVSPPPEPLRFPKFAWPARDTNASRHMIDLSPHYNALLNVPWELIDHENYYDDDFSNLPTGIVTLANVSFDVRGLIRLATTTNEQFRGAVSIPSPEAVPGIAVAAKARSIHILHGTDRSMPEGTVLCRYVLRYTDGSREEIPVLYGRDVREIWELDNDLKPATDSGIVAWRGTNPAVTRRNGRLRVFRTVFENPRPGMEIQSIDLISALPPYAYLVIALTLEP